MLKTYPDFSDNLAMASSFFTSLKWSLLAVITFIIGAAIWLLTFYKMTRGKVVGR
jgi:cytoskeletal protein RodZ